MTDIDYIYMQLWHVFIRTFLFKYYISCLTQLNHQTSVKTLKPLWFINLGIGNYTYLSWLKCTWKELCYPVLYCNWIMLPLTIHHTSYLNLHFGPELGCITVKHTGTRCYIISYIRRQNSTNIVVWRSELTYLTTNIDGTLI